MIMNPPDDNPAPEDAIKSQLDQEITSLRSQISTLKSRRQLQVATILSSYSPNAIPKLQPPHKHSKSTTTISTTLPTDPSPLIAASKSQALHNQENLYRACSSITTFRVQDPDPNAVDNGRILGVRIDVSSAGKFLRPYYIMLNKPIAGNEALRVHRHTVPPCIHLEEFATKYLPAPKNAAGDMGKNKKQYLTRFMRALRREIVGYHNRATAIKILRKEFRLDEKTSRKGKAREKIIADIAAADAEAKQIRIEWVDGRVGRVMVGEKGEVVRCVVTGEDGRDWDTERRICGLGEEGRRDMLGIGERLKEGIY